MQGKRLSPESARRRMQGKRLSLDLLGRFEERLPEV
jgi:hypothetical protein